MRRRACANAQTRQNICRLHTKHIGCRWWLKAKFKPFASIGVKKRLSLPICDMYQNIMGAPSTAKVIWRRGHGLESYPRELMVGISTTPRRLLMRWHASNKMKAWQTYRYHKWNCKRAITHERKPKMQSQVSPLKIDFVLRLGHKPVTRLLSLTNQA